MKTNKKNLLMKSAAVIAALGQGSPLLAQSTSLPYEDLAPVCEMQINGVQSEMNRLTDPYTSELSGLYALTDAVIGELPKSMAGDGSEEARVFADITGVSTRLKSIYDGIVTANQQLEALRRRHQEQLNTLRNEINEEANPHRASVTALERQLRDTRAARDAQAQEVIQRQQAIDLMEAQLQALRVELASSRRGGGVRRSGGGGGGPLPAFMGGGSSSRRGRAPDQATGARRSRTVVQAEIDALTQRIANARQDLAGLIGSVSTNEAGEPVGTGLRFMEAVAAAKETQLEAARTLVSAADARIAEAQAAQAAELRPYEESISRLRRLMPVYLGELTSRLQGPMARLGAQARANCDIRRLPDSLVESRWGSLATTTRTAAARRDAARRGVAAPDRADIVRSAFTEPHGAGPRITQCEQLTSAHWDPLHGTVTVCMGMPMRSGGAYRACSTLDLAHSSAEGMQVSHNRRFVYGSNEYSESEFIRQRLSTQECRVYFDARNNGAGMDLFLMGEADAQVDSILSRLDERAARDARAPGTALPEPAELPAAAESSSASE